ncbi:uncharacterized protein BT62DRAFT_921880 [Guyanagaster necrorhizus]|uniref:Uncharacterized protein n=1 Tax=Guyanagaster necrorhizus TaxID=856835 RepID=A0A9P7VLI4_9AGAR|nr:uncharacterized protein BT62DRAFT_921880 [Guyanagaster necrorhizus MCA 3950]KAG7443371.1 hypothetical protein BT62DRAFT_921880 [Guyanagaster necrorhizus MCA 3950]
MPRDVLNDLRYIEFRARLTTKPGIHLRNNIPAICARSKSSHCAEIIKWASATTAPVRNVRMISTASSTQLRGGTKAKEYASSPACGVMTVIWFFGSPSASGNHDFSMSGRLQNQSTFGDECETASRESKRKRDSQNIPLTTTSQLGGFFHATAAYETEQYLSDVPQSRI